MELVKDIVSRFHHLARDLFVYFFPGFFLLLYLMWVDWNYGNGIIFHHLFFISNWNFMLVIIAYVIGHLIAPVSFLLESFERMMNLTESRESKKDIRKEMEILIDNAHLYETYINRYSDLMYFRYHLKGAIFIVFLFSFYHFFVSVSKVNFLLLIIALVFFIGISLLESRTEKDFYERLDIARGLTEKSQ